jgi:hypothetical protein
LPAGNQIASCVCEPNSQKGPNTAQQGPTAPSVDLSKELGNISQQVQGTPQPSPFESYGVYGPPAPSPPSRDVSRAPQTSPQTSTQGVIGTTQNTAAPNPGIGPSFGGRGEGGGFENDQSGVSLANHKKGARPSTQEDHENGLARIDKDKGGEKADKDRRPQRIRPDGHKGLWPQKD